MKHNPDLLFRVCICALIILIASMFSHSPAPGAEPHGNIPNLEKATAADAYIAGYATAIITRELRLKNVTVTVENGNVFLITNSANTAFVKHAKELISKLPGVNKVTVRVRGEPAEDGGKELTDINKDNAATVDLPAGPGRKTELFKPLIADLRWPRFSGSIQNYFDKKPRSADNKFLSNVIAVSLGETMPLFHWDRGSYEFEFGLHGAAFGVFDLRGESFDLINTDFWIAPIAVGYRSRQTSGLFRFYHQSSHLGDEFILRDAEVSKFALQDVAKNRVNLSYWALSILVSQDIGERFRVYGGGEYMIDGPAFLDKEPNDLEEITIQYGVEYRSLPFSWLGFASLKAVGGADFKTQEESNWKTGVSLRAGLELENPAYPDAVFRLMAEYFNGRSPTGQFYRRAVEYYGIGVSTDF